MHKSRLKIEVGDGSIIVLIGLMIILFLLKLFKIIEIEWIMVLSPLWVPGSILILMLTLKKVYKTFIKNTKNKI